MHLAAVGKTAVPINNWLRAMAVGMASEHTGDLSKRMELAIGTKVTVILNIVTAADIANSTRGTIVDIIPRKSCDHEGGEGRLAPASCCPDSTGQYDTDPAFRVKPLSTSLLTLLTA